MALRYYTSCQLSRTRHEAGNTHVRLDVEVLQVEGMLPDINANEGDERQKRILVGRSSDLEALRRGVVSLVSKPVSESPSKPIHDAVIRAANPKSANTRTKKSDRK